MGERFFEANRDSASERAVESAIIEGDLNALVLHLADAGVDAKRSFEAICDTLVTIAESYEDSSRKVPEFEVIGEDSKGSPISISGSDKQFHAMRAGRLRELAQAIISMVD